MSDPSTWGPVIDLSGKPWKKSVEFENAINAGKGNSTQAKFVGDDGHLIGTLGEFALAMSPFGLKFNLQVNLAVHHEGDGHADFDVYGKKIDAKASTHFAEPWLREFLDPKHHADYFVLVAIDMERKLGQVHGWATRSILMRPATWRYIYQNGRNLGKRYVIEHWDFYNKEWDTRIRPINELEEILMLEQAA